MFTTPLLAAQSKQFWRRLKYPGNWWCVLNLIHMETIIYWAFRAIKRVNKKALSVTCRCDCLWYLSFSVCWDKLHLSVAKQAADFCRKTLCTVPLDHRQIDQVDYDWKAVKPWDQTGNAEQIEILHTDVDWDEEQLGGHRTGSPDGIRWEIQYWQLEDRCEGPE